MTALRSRLSLLSQTMCLFVCRLSCVLRAPYSWNCSFRQNFFNAVYAGHPLTSVQNFTEIVSGEPLRGSVKRKRGSIIEQCWWNRRRYLINGARYGLGYNQWLIGNDTSGIHWCNFQWPWSIRNPDFKVIGVSVVNSREIAVIIPHRAHIFYPNVTTWRSGICHRKSVCLSLTFVVPIQRVEVFGNISLPLYTSAILWPPCKILRRSSQGNPPHFRRGLKRKMGTKIKRRWTCRRL